MKYDHPSGMSSAALRTFERTVENGGYTKIGKVATKYGDVYVAEKWKGQRWRVTNYIWHVIWCARNMAGDLDCRQFSSQKSRTEAAVGHALEHLGHRESVFQEL